MLLQRWSNYVENGHGGNIELKKLVEEKGFDYVKKIFPVLHPRKLQCQIDDHIILDVNLGGRIPFRVENTDIMQIK